MSAEPRGEAVERRVLDVSALPPIAFGARDPMWWGMNLMSAIEGTMLVLLAISYYYVGGRTSPWPPVLTPHRVPWIATADLALLIVSIPPAHAAAVAAVRGEATRMRVWLAVTIALGLGALICRWLIFAKLPFRWDQSAYASVVWLMLGLQTFHLITGVGEDLLLLAICVVRPIEAKHRVDVQVSTALWYFVIAGAALQWAVIFLAMLMSPAPVRFGG